METQNSFSFVTTLTTEQIKTLIKDSLKELLRNGKSLVQASQDQDEILTVDQAVKLTGLAKSTIYEKTSKRLIPHFKRGKKLYFKRAELITWLTEGKVKTQDELSSQAMDFLIKKK